MSLAQQERALGYAIPILQSQGMDPYDVMAASTAMARAGITSTKAGTWIREAAVRAMPGTNLMSQVAFHKHEAALKAFGLVDDHDKPTWFENGAPSLTRLLEIVSQNAQKIPLDKRMSYERQLFGAQGSGAIAVLGEGAVRDQMLRMREAVKDPRALNDVRNWMTIDGEQSSLQNARTTVQTFNVLMADIGERVLPAVNNGLSRFKSILDGIRGMLPGADKDKSAANVGGAALVGGVAGAAAGLAVGAAGGPSARWAVQRLVRRAGPLWP
jgi:TP901 family phage tail tape measure protein